MVDVEAGVERAERELRRVAGRRERTRGATARAWYQGAPPSGTPVQDALDKFTADGYQFAAIATGGLPGQVVSGGSSMNPGDAALDAAFVILLQR